MTKNAQQTPQQIEWTSTMHGNSAPSGIVVAHAGADALRVNPRGFTREQREEIEALGLSDGATRSIGAGNRAREEEPDPFRTCFERDRDRILHASAFRRLAGKTQVFIFPEDHQRTRLTHAIEVAQVATAIARTLGLNVALAEAIALGHDCGHGPGGHASEDAFSPYVEGGYHHAVWGADVSLAPLNLCAETLDGVRNHSWSRPAPITPEGEVVAWADRFAYCTADLDDAIHARLVSIDDLPSAVTRLLGGRQSQQINTLVTALIQCTEANGVVGLDADHAEALAALRSFNYERVYSRAESQAQAESVTAVLHALVEFFIENTALLPDGYLPEGCLDATNRPPRQVRATAAVAYVSGMTDRFAFGSAVELIDWPTEKLPVGFDLRLFARDDAYDLAITA
ncbi:MAG: HD domain-containing protein [Microthrixaceae bacterium]